MAGRRVAPAFLIACFVTSSVVAARAADRLVGQLANDPSLIALSIPIDYWDYLGWRDTLANPAHSARQRAYARARGDGQVYTPQIVVNGATDALGSDQGAVERAIVQANHKAGVMSLPVLVSVSNGAVNVDVASADKVQDPAEVWLCPLAKSVAVTIGRGENRGRTITYHNVVRNWVKLGSLSGIYASWSVPISQIKIDGIDAAAVMVQEGTRERPGIILGAAYTPLQ